MKNENMLMIEKDSRMIFELFMKDLPELKKIENVIL